MANSNAPQGLKYLGDINTGIATGVVNEYVIPSTDVTDYFIGDPVKSTGTSTTDGLPTVIIAAAGDTLRGAIVGFLPNPTNLNITYGPASTTRYALVADAPFARFLIQSNGTGAITDIGANADLVSGSGSTATGFSGWQLNEATVDPATAQLRILRIYPTPDNAYGANVKYQVMINEHELKSTAGV